MLNFFKKNQSPKSESELKKPSLKERLFKSKTKLGDGLSSLLIGKKKIDERPSPSLVLDLNSLSFSEGFFGSPSDSGL